MSTTEVTTAPRTKLLPIANAWLNDRRNGENSPVMTIKIDRDLGLDIRLVAGAQLVAFANAKREGRQDADYRLAVQVPADVAEAEIARQKNVRQSRMAQVTPVVAATPAAPVAPAPAAEPAQA